MEFIKEVSFDQYSVKLFTYILIIVTTIWAIKYNVGRWKLYQGSSKFPGPLALPLIGSAYLFTKHDVAENIMSILKSFPDICKVWITNRLYILLTKPEHMRIVLMSPDALQKDIIYKLFEIGVGHGLGTAPVDVWKKNRKRVMPTFNQKNLNKLVDIFSRQCEVLLDVMAPLVGKKVVDVEDLVTKCTLDIICETALGLDIQAQTSNNLFARHMESGFAVISKRMFHPLLFFDVVFNLTADKKVLAKNIAFMDKFIEDIIEIKQKKLEQDAIELVAIDENRQMAFLDFLLECKEGDKFTHKEIRDEVMMFMIAGTETTAATMCFLFSILGLYPDVQQKIYEEAIEVLGPYRKVETEDIPNFKYLERAIKETLRIFPIAAFVSRTCVEDIDLKDGYVIPKGASVIASFLHTHRNPKYWPNPMKFDPDRFLPEEVAKRHPLTFAPFSYGPRNCIADRYAYMVMKTIVPMVVRNFVLKTGYNNIEEIEICSAISTKATHGYKVSFEKRH